MDNNEIKLRPKNISMSTEGWRLKAVEMPDVNLYIEPEKTERATIKTIKVNSKKERPKSVEVF